MIDTTYFEGIGIALISACYGTKTSTSNVPLSNKKNQTVGSEKCEIEIQLSNNLFV